MWALWKKMLNVVVLVHFVTTTLAATVNNSSSCPLDLEKFTFSPDPECSAYHSGYQTSRCCMSSLAHLALVLADYSNTTDGQQLFLDSPTERDCAAQIYATDIITETTCSVSPPYFTAYGSPCFFGKIAELAGNLSAGPSATHIDAITASCHDLSNSELCHNCLSSFQSGMVALASKMGDSDNNCGSALVVALLSQNATEANAHALYKCIDFPASGWSMDGTAVKSGAHNSLSVGVAAALVVVSTLLLLLLVLGVLVYVRMYCCYTSEELVTESCDEKDYNVQPEQEVLGFSEGLYSFSSKELLRATDNFSIRNFIGEGSAGKVYRGVLPSGQMVAIKLIVNEKKLDTFYKEVENLSRVRHNNLVTLLGYCQTSSEHLLVYEYCSRGNLWYYLFGEGPVLSWERRIMIALGSARGLWYLHLYPGGSIVHRDIKPTNILLTEQYEAKVSDFGLSRFIGMEESRVFTEVKGTAGYLDPEYLSMGTLTFASDIYSFGIVLLQLISGRRPIDLDPMGRLSLVKLANLVLKGGGELSELVDPKLEGSYPVLAFQKMADIAVQCTSEHAFGRPSMIEVLNGLEEVWRLAKSEVPLPQSNLITSSSEFLLSNSLKGSVEGYGASYTRS